MKLLKYIGLFLLMILSTIVNIIELILIGLFYALFALGYALSTVFKPVAEWLVELLKKFNFLTVSNISRG